MVDGHFLIGRHKGGIKGFRHSKSFIHVFYDVKRIITDWVISIGCVITLCLRKDQENMNREI